MKKIISIFIVFFAVNLVFAQKNVAVLEIERRGDALNEIRREEAMEITGVIRSAAVRTLPRGQFNVMTSETVQAMGGAALAECFDETCVIALGRTIDAEYVVRGVLSKFQTLFTLNIEMFETEYGNLVATSESVRSENLIELLSASESVCVEMYRTFLGASAAQPAQSAQPTTPATTTTQIQTTTTTATTATTETQTPSVVVGEPEIESIIDMQTIEESTSTLVHTPTVETEESRERKVVDHFFAPKWFPPITDYTLAGLGFNLEYGQVRGNGWWWSVDGGLSWKHDRDYYYDDYDNSILFGGTLNIGAIHEFSNNVQFAYGGSVGFWAGFFRTAGDDDDYRDNLGFIGPIVRLRWQFVEVTYRGLLGVRQVWDGDDDSSSGLGYISQLMIGFHFSSKNKGSTPRPPREQIHEPIFFDN